MAPKPRVLYWFRTDLRLHDSPGLKAAIDLNPECLYPIWTWDPHYVYHARVGPNRWQFLYLRPILPTPSIADLGGLPDLIVSKTSRIVSPSLTRRVSYS